MKLDNLGLPRFADRDIIDLIYKGNKNKIGQIFAESSTDVKLFNKIMEDLRGGIQIMHDVFQRAWDVWMETSCENKRHQSREEKSIFSRVVQSMNE